MKTGKKLLTGVFLVLCGALLTLCIVFATGWNKAAKADAALPEVRNNGTAIQWKYSDEANWHDLVALSELRGAAGENGKNGIDGKDGVNGVDGQDGVGIQTITITYDGILQISLTNGTTLDLGTIKGEKGDKGDTGAAGKDGNTPFIGENGSWWIGDTDTGIKAAGEKGEKGAAGGGKNRAPAETRRKDRPAEAA